MPFVHLHVHTFYSVLDGASRIKDLLMAASEYHQPALAITDHGNMFGVKEFLDTAKKLNNGVKPIIGSEMYIARGSRTERKGREDQSSYHLILLAKNMQGYHNLAKLSSLSYIEGFHYKPRIDHELLEKYHEGLICSSACLGGEIPQAILEGDINKAEELIEWYKHLFGDDFYLEVMRHETDIPGAETSTFELQQKVNDVIFPLAQKHNVKVIATNDVHFVKKEDGKAHDRLICINTNSDFDDPKRLRYTQQEYLKTTQEMEEIFKDHPEVISNTLEIADKVEVIDLDSNLILPLFPLPDGYSDSNEYLRDLTFQGARKRYGETMDPSITERLNFELDTIKKMGFPDYFLIVQDFIAAARNMGVWVGPGRGSAAGSAVAYSLYITNIDPIKYHLLFERFLNPDRISMPDIDIDFDDEGRYKVLQYVETKYGKDHVSHVITFGTLAAKSAIRDVGRIQKLPLQETDRLAKLIPDKFTVEEADKEEDANGTSGTAKKKKTKDVPPTIRLCLEKVKEFQEASNSDNQLVKDTIFYADKLEGTVRNTGVHACATIIGRDDLSNYIPICTAKDKDTGQDILVSQYEGTLIESVGMLKMDFLGLKTLSILRDCVNNIKLSKGVDIDINTIPIDDELTYQLFSRGDTIGVFQFESDGMQKWLRELKPSRFEDLIAMNALYRPGPMNYIPDFVARKHGDKKIEYDLPDMSEYLQDTYGVTVYQEQVMLLSQKLAGFSKGQADTLRKAMGKKNRSVMAKLREQFFAGGLEHGYPEATLNKIWNDWKSFSDYAFNKSHATCYAWIGYQTGYLKAHYPAEYMAATLSNSANNMKDITKFMDDCRKKNILVLSPDINESYTNFTVNKEGNIRFGMAGIKGIGSIAIDSIIEVRKEGGPFKDIFDFIERVNLSTINKKGIEALAFSGAFDCFPDINRGSFSVEAGKGETFTDILLRYGARFQKDSISNNNNLFGGGDAIETSKPTLPIVPPLDKFEMLRKEKELVGMYISDHPLNQFRFEIEHFTTGTIEEVQEKAAEAMKNESLFGKEYIIAGIVTGVEERTSKNNKLWSRLTIEDFVSNMTFTLFGKDHEAFLSYKQLHYTLLLDVILAPRYPYLSPEEKEKQRSRDGKYEHPKPIACEPKIKAITLLSNAREKFIKEIVLSLDVSMLNQSFRKEFIHTLKTNKGNTVLSLKVSDSAHKLTSEFFSGKYKVEVSDELINFLDRYNISYSLVTNLNF